MARKNALFDVLGDAYVRGMARNVNALAEIAGKPFPDPRVYARGAEFVPGVGDAVGLGQDVRGYAENPSSLTPWAGLWSLAAMAPGVPNKSATKAADSIRVYRAQTKGRKSVGQWWTADKNVAEEFQGLWGGPKKVEILEMDISPEEFDAFLEAAEKSGKSIPQEQALLFPKGWKPKK